jgi:hypothetical protein
MRKLLLVTTVSLFALSLVFAAEKGSIKLLKGQKMVRKHESQPIFLNDGAESSKPVIHNNRNGSVLTLVDSSTNGFGMVSSVTRPISVSDDQWFISYRQYCGVNTTHGQLGGAYSEDGESWTIYNNLNSNGSPPWGGDGVGGVGSGQARYPSVVTNEDFPFAIWNEYTGIVDFGSAYGGRPYYTYDEFEWDGGGFAYPYELDLLWQTDAKDLWLGSPAMSYNESNDTYVTVASYSDWTRNNNYVFTSEVYEDGFLVFGEEQIIIDEAVCLVGGTADGSFNTSVAVSINDGGQGVAGLIGLFNGCDPDNLTGSPYTDGCYHQPIFKMTNDYGLSWSGNENICGEGGGLYHIPDGVFLDIIGNSFPDSYSNDCTGEYADIVDFWSYYDFDFKVDADGDVHILMSMMPSGIESLSGESYLYFIEGAGWYHFTIDSDYLDNPGQVNTETGWNWSMVVEAKDTWLFTDNAGNNNISNTMASLSFSKDDPDIVWVVTDLMSDYCGELYDDGGTPDPCDDLYEYRDASEDIYVFKSEDNGSNWFNAYNATETPDNPEDYPSGWAGDCPPGLTVCGPEETYPHAAPWSSDDAVYYMFQMPNYGFNEVGDFGDADHMNFVYVGLTEVTENDSAEYPVECEGGSLCNDLGDATGDGVSDILDIVTIVNHILGSANISDDLSFCGADITEDGVVDILDIVTIVNNILGAGRLDDAYKVNFNKTGNILEMSANGFISAIQMTISHDSKASLEFLGESMVSAHITNEGSTTLIMVVPNQGPLFELSSSDGFVIQDIKVANSSGLIASTVVDQFALMSSYPNPFNPETTISFELFSNSNIDLAIYNMVGQRVSTLMNGFQENGSYDIEWNGTDSYGSELASGIYMVKLVTEQGVLTNKITLLK